MGRDGSEGPYFVVRDGKFVEICLTRPPAMYSDKTVARHLVHICAAKGMEHVVIAPGSRNAPLTLSFNHHPDIGTTVLVDERSAAFFALGLAQMTGRPVGVLCSSGSAGANFFPAITEAFYQRIPLVAITADRPEEWIDQSDGQTIRQRNMFGEHVRKSVHLPAGGEDEETQWYADRLIGEALDHAIGTIPGPVHINIPFREPLYGVSREEFLPKVVETVAPKPVLTDKACAFFREKLAHAERVMILIGLCHEEGGLTKMLEPLAQLPSVVVMTETTSNLPLSGAIDRIDEVLTTLSPDEVEAFSPDLLITAGGPVVSKKIKQFLRTNRPEAHWHIDPEGEYLDTYQSLTHHVPVQPGEFFRVFSGVNGVPSSFREQWLGRKKAALAVHDEFLAETSFCDLTVFDQALSAVPENSILHLGNSSPVRYAQLFGPKKDILQMANRGTSGIDGVLSTAVGAAAGTDKWVTVILGDLGFFYDSNALWNPELPGNLRVIVINNGGGGIFRIIEGPDTTEELESHFEAAQDLKAEGIARAFGIPYLYAGEEWTLQEHLGMFWEDMERPALLEVSTPREQNAVVLRELFSRLKASTNVKPV